MQRTTLVTASVMVGNNFTDLKAESKGSCNNYHRSTKCSCEITSTLQVYAGWWSPAPRCTLANCCHIQASVGAWEAYGTYTVQHYGGQSVVVCDGYIYLAALRQPQQVNNNAAPRGNIISRTFANCSINVKLVVFKTYCSCLYTSQLWGTCLSRTMNRLKVAYNDSLRMVLGIPGS